MREGGDALLRVRVPYTSLYLPISPYISLYLAAQAAARRELVHGQDALEARSP